MVRVELKTINKKPPAIPPPLWDLAILTIGLALLFFLFTNGIPLIQLGWLKPFKSKNRYLVPMRIALTAFSLLLAGLYWRKPVSFENLSAVRFLKKFLRLPLWPLVSILFVSYSLTFSAVGFARHAAIETRAFDLGIFAQAVWNTLHGNFLFSSIKGDINLLGDHVSPILALLVPFYKLWPDPRTLLVLQAIAAASCLFPIAFLAEDKFRDRFLTLVFVLLYFFYLPTRGALHEDFHPEVLIESALLAAFIFLERKNLTGLLFSLGLAILAKENMLGVSFILGLYALIFKRWPRVGLPLMLFSVFFLWFDIHWVVPHFSAKSYLYKGFYQELIASPPEVIRRLVGFESLEYLFKIFFPFLFLPFFHLPTLILTFPVLFQNLLSNGATFRSFGYHYTTGLSPFVFIASIYGFARLIEKKVWVAKHRKEMACLLLVVGLMNSGPSEYYFFWQSRKHTNAHTALIRRNLSEIPSEFSVLTHNSFIPQLINRKRIYQFGYNQTPTKADDAAGRGIDYVIFDRQFWEPGTLGVEETLRQLKERAYRIEFAQDGFYILLRPAIKKIMPGP